MSDDNPALKIIRDDIESSIAEQHQKLSRYNDIIPRPLTEEEEAAYAESARKADVFTTKLTQLHELFESMDDFEREIALDDLKARWAPDYDD